MSKAIFAVLSLFLLSSCVSKKRIVYFQNPGSSATDVNYHPHLEKDDLLMIIVSSSDFEAAANFNLPIISVMANAKGTADASSQLQYQTYLIDNAGFIQFPILGALKVGGLTRDEAVALLTTKLKGYIKDPAVNLRVVNYKVSVLGEVTRPGTFNVVSERITLLEALGLAGDMTIYGKRENVVVVREVNGKVTYNVVNLTKADFVNSPYYYLSQNDVVYVEPNKTRINSAAVGPNASLWLGAGSILIALVALLR